MLLSGPTERLYLFVLSLKQFTDDITEGNLFISSMLLKAALSRMINGGIYGQNIFQ